MNPQITSFSNILRVVTNGAHSASSDFDLNPEVRNDWPTTGPLREAAVLVPLIERSRGIHVVLTKRAAHLKHHPGQIAFPGGKREETDASLKETALREAHEEIGLVPDNVEIFGKLPFHETVTHFRVTPIVGRIRNSFDPTPEMGEVEEVFEVPLSYLGNPENYMIEGRFWGGVKRRYYVIPYGPHYIWGATARILRGFAERLNA